MCTNMVSRQNNRNHDVALSDCGKFWECGPEGLCLFECPACVPDSNTCPEGRLQFDCRYEPPLGPVCDWANAVGCNNCQESCQAANCPFDQTCDPTTDCECSDCRLDSDCSNGEQCCERTCAVDCQPCLTECCADTDCPVTNTRI